jgi:hypothetical protein
MLMIHAGEAIEPCGGDNAGKTRLNNHAAFAATTLMAVVALG